VRTKRTRNHRCTIAAVLVAVAAALVAGCGSSGGSDKSGSSGTGDLVVSGATSLKKAFTTYGQEFAGATVRFSFAGSDELAAQIQQGVKPDVFASANTRLPDMLHAKGLVGTPTVFASNRLVIAVPAQGAKVASVADLAKPGTTIAIGSASVPIGSYTRRVLSGLGAGESAAILKNVRSNEPDVGGVVGKVAQGAVDAGFVYVTDVDGAGGKVKAIALPPTLQPSVAYGVAVVSGAKHPEQARRFIAGLLSGTGQAALKQAGFGPPPAGK
jgi:molybdate transport system substrate-binding protein